MRLCIYDAGVILVLNSCMLHWVLRVSNGRLIWYYSMYIWCWYCICLDLVTWEAIVFCSFCQVFKHGFCNFTQVITTKFLLDFLRLVIEVTLWIDMAKSDKLWNCMSRWTQMSNPTTFPSIQKFNDNYIQNFPLFVHASHSIPTYTTTSK